MRKNIKNSEVVNRIRRFSIVVYLRKFSWLFITILLFLLSVLVGVWNVRDVEFSDQGIWNSDANSLHSSVQEYMGDIIFLIVPSELEEKVKEKNKFVKGVILEKRIPNRLFIQIEEHTPGYSTYALDKCLLFSKEGIIILKVCEECEDSCREEVSVWPSVYITSSNGLESSDTLIFYEEIRDIVKVLKTFGHQTESISIDNSIATFESLNEKLFIFEISNNLEVQLSRMFLVGQKINEENIDFKSLDLRFERPLMKLK